MAQQNHADVVEDWNEAVGLYASAYYTAKLDYFDMAAMFVIQWNFMLPAATPTSDVSNGLSYLDSLLDAGTGEPALAYDVSAAASSLASADAAFKAAMMAADGAGGYPSVAQMAACETTESSFLSAVDAYEDATEEYEDWLKRQPLGSSYGVVLSNSDRFTSLINWLQTAYAMLAGYPD